MLTSPVRIFVEWNGIPPLHTVWERTFLEAVSDFNGHGVHVHERVSSAPLVDLSILAYMASGHGDALVVKRVTDLQQHQLANPTLRFAVAACGAWEEELTDSDVSTLVCSDDQTARRHSNRVIEPIDFHNHMVDWLTVTAQGKLNAGQQLPDAADNYDSEAIIARESAPEKDMTWLGQY